MVVEHRDTGINGLGALPWNSHICLLYGTKQDMLSVMVPYLEAGLKNNEFCLWIASRSPGVKETTRILAEQIPLFSDATAKKQIEIIHYKKTCFQEGKFDIDLFHRMMGAKRVQATESGYSGLRAAFDLSWAEKEDWIEMTKRVANFRESENILRMLALFAYPLEKCGVEEYLNLIGALRYTLIINNGKLTQLGNSVSLPLQEAKKKIQRQYHSQLQKVRKELRENQKKFFETLRVSPGVISITTLEDGKFIEVNDNFCRGTGFRREEVIGRSAVELGIWPDTETRAWMVAKLKKQHRVQNEEAVFRTKSGEKRNVLYSCELINVDGKPCVILIVNDITEEIRRREEGRAIISTAMDGFWITDLNGKFLEVNDSYCQMIGYTREELLKMSISDIEAIERPGDVANHIKKVIINGSDRFKTQHRTKDGRIIDIGVNTSYYNVGEGQLFVFIRDLTGRNGIGVSRETRVQTSWRQNLTKLQEKFIKEGFQDFTDREIIELLLSLVMPAREAKNLAIKCVEKFGNFGHFLEASPEKLTQIGVTPACVFCITMLHKLPIKVLQDKIRTKSIFDSPQDVFDYLYYSMRDLKEEVFKVIYLDSRNHILSEVDLYEGTTDKIAINAREVVEGAIINKSKSLVFVHNHPSGDPTPSRADRKLTRDLVFVGNIIQIKVIDHIIIGEKNYFSFAQGKLIEEYNTDFMNLKLAGTSEAKRRLSKAKRRLPKS